MSYNIPQANDEPVLKDSTNAEYDAHAALDEALAEGEDNLELAIVTALKVTQGARQSTYSHPAINFINTALLWTKDAHDRGEIKYPRIITPYSVAQKMALLKTARLASSAHRDGAADRLGYESCEDRVAVFLIKHGFVQPGYQAWERAQGFFDGWTYEQLSVFYRLVLAKLDDEDGDVYQNLRYRWNRYSTE